MELREWFLTVVKESDQKAKIIGIKIMMEMPMLCLGAQLRTENLQSAVKLKKYNTSFENIHSAKNEVFP